MTLIIAIIVCILSVLIMWKYVHVAYSKGGIWEIITPAGNDIIVVFCPIVNTLGCIGWLIQPPIKKQPGKKRNYNKFFNIKKDTP